MRPVSYAPNVLAVTFGIEPPDQRGVTTLPDGRGLCWSQWGPADGVPILYFPGAAMGSGLGFGAQLLEPLGIRLIAVDRPGLGGSDPDPGRTLLSWPRDVQDLTAALRLTTYGILAFSHGGPFALACVALGVGAAAAVVAGQDDLRHPALTPLVDPQLAGMLGALDADPAGFEAGFAKQATAAMMWELIVRSSAPADRAVYTDPAFETAYRACLAEGLAQGGAGYARDFALTMGPWPFDLTAVSVPVDLWYGELDSGTVHSPDHGQILTTRIPGARLHTPPAAGGSLLWTDPTPVLTTLITAVTDL